VFASVPQVFLLAAVAIRTLDEKGRVRVTPGQSAGGDVISVYGEHSCISPDLTIFTA
jgi:hypothetical protein